MKKNRECICCNTQYSYCPSCGGSDRFKESWYSEFCSVDCKDLWMTATKYNMQMLTKEEAKEIIKTLNLKDKSEYVKCVQKDLENIFYEEVKQEEKPQKHAAKAAKAHEVVNKTEE